MISHIEAPPEVLCIPASPQSLPFQFQEEGALVAGQGHIHIAARPPRLMCAISPGSTAGRGFCDLFMPHLCSPLWFITISPPNMDNALSSDVDTARSRSYNLGNPMKYKWCFMPYTGAANPKPIGRVKENAPHARTKLINLDARPCTTYSQSKIGMDDLESPFFPSRPLGLTLLKIPSHWDCR